MIKLASSATEISSRSDLIQEVQAVTTSSHLCKLHITGKCSVPFRWTEQLRHFSHDKMYQGPHYLLAVSVRTFVSPALLRRWLVSVGSTRLEGEREPRRLHTQSADPSRPMVTAECSCQVKPQTSLSRISVNNSTSN